MNVGPFALREILVDPMHSLRAGVGNCFSQRATCGKTKSIPGRIIKWIKLICSTTIIVRVALIGKQKKKKGLHTPQMSCFPPKISVKQWRSEKLQKEGHNFHIF